MGTRRSGSSETPATPPIESGRLRCWHEAISLGFTNLVRANRTGDELSPDAFVIMGNLPATAY